MPAHGEPWAELDGFVVKRSPGVPPGILIAGNPAGRRQNKMSHAKTIGWTLFLFFMFLAGALVAFLYREPRGAFDIGDYSHVDIRAAEEAFCDDGSNQALVLLVKALCFRQEALGERGWEDRLLMYGRELYTRARNETVDLQAVDDENIMGQVLSVLRGIGAHR